MFSSFFGIAPTPKEPEPKEGDLYKVITVHGKTFELYYGYYEDIDRRNPRCKPTEMYPNFKDKPQYTDKGIPFATAMQKPCEHFKLGVGRIDEGEDNMCLYCAHYENCEELLGICKCPKRRKRSDGQ